MSRADDLLQIQVDDLPYVSRLERRRPDEIDLVVIHCTELPDLATAREYGEQIHYPPSGTGNSGHFYIDRDGSVCQYVPVNRVAHHVYGFNRRSVGIELVNIGRYPQWHHTGHQRMSEPYPEAQIQALDELLGWLREQVPTLMVIAGHEALDTRMIPASDDPQREVPRKMDPGPLFPWDRILKNHPLDRIE